MNSDVDLIPLTTKAALQAAFAQEWAVVYKHSNRCWISALTIRQVRRFAKSHPETPVYQVDVIEARDLSMALAQSVGIQHQSPQALVVNRGRVVWHDSHFGVKAKALSEARGGA